MSIDDWFVAGSGALIMLMYCVIGIGVARMLAKIKNREIRIFDVFVWPIVCGVFATAGDCE